MGRTEPHNDIEGLVRSAADGDHRAFEALMARFAPLIGARIFGTGRPYEDTQDLIQEVMLKAYCQLSSLRNPARFSSWLSTLSINVARDHARRRKETPAGPDDAIAIPDPAPGPGEFAAGTELETTVLELIQALGARQRDVLYLSLFTGLSSREIGELLGVKESAVRMRLSKGVKALRNALLARGYEQFASGFTEGRRPRQSEN